MTPVDKPRIIWLLGQEPIAASRPRIPRYGKPYYGKRYTAYRNYLRDKFDSIQATDPLHYHHPVTIDLTFFGPRRGTDLDNLAKGVLDAMVEAKILQDDNWEAVRRLTVTAHPCGRVAERGLCIDITPGFLSPCI